MDVWIYILLVIDAALIFFLTFGKGKKKGLLIPSVLLVCFAVGIMFYRGGQTEMFYLGGLILVLVWAAKLGIG